MQFFRERLIEFFSRSRDNSIQDNSDYSYDGVKDRSLRDYLETFEQTVMPTVPQWPFRTGDISYNYIPKLLGYSKVGLSVFTNKLLTAEILPIVWQKPASGRRRNPIASFDPDSMRALVSLCWSYDQLYIHRGQERYLDEESLRLIVTKAKESLGSHPLGDLIREPLPPQPSKDRPRQEIPKARVETKAPVENKPPLEKPRTDAEERGNPVVINSRSSGQTVVENTDLTKAEVRADQLMRNPLDRIPTLAEVDMETLGAFTRERLLTLLSEIPGDSFEFAFGLRGVLPGAARVIMAIDALNSASLGRRSKLQKFDHDLEELSNRDFREALNVNLGYLLKFPQFQNLAQLYRAIRTDTIEHPEKYWAA